MQHHQWEIPGLRLLLAASLVASGQAAGAIRGIWSNRTLGPDGPWNALEIMLGSGQTVTTYGGKMWESYFLGSKYCTSTATGSQRCYAAEKGSIYYENQGTGSSQGIQYSPGNFWSPSLQTKGSAASWWPDNLYVGGDTSQWGLGPIPNISMTILRDTQVLYPSGKTCPLFAGCLSFGAAPNAINQTFKVVSSSLAGAKNLSLLAGSLSSRDKIGSNSFGMHIGTAGTPSMSGSLWYGGYDQNRAVGQMLAVPIQPDYTRYIAELSDISITTLAGDTPFSFESKSGLLASGNDTIGKFLDVGIEPCVPYLNLPKSTCDAIASNLPVTYSEDLGLYLWNTKAPEYSRIVTSAAALTFSFPDPTDNSRLVSISVPFRHLNLTLEDPLVSSPTPYFPCNAFSKGSYSLGRAFLQDAFFGANFESAIMYLAQAPGPNIKAENVVNMNANDTIQASRNDLVKSWEGFWSLKGETVKNSTTGGSGGSSNTNGTSNSGGNNNGTTSNTPLIAGLAGGLGGGLALAALGLLFFFLRRRKGQNQPQQPPTQQYQQQYQQPPNQALPHGYYAPKYESNLPELSTLSPSSEAHSFSRAELAAGESYQSHQLPGQYDHAYEMPASHPHGPNSPGMSSGYGTYTGAEPTWDGGHGTYGSGETTYVPTSAGVTASGSAGAGNTLRQQGWHSQGQGT